MSDQSMKHNEYVELVESPMSRSVFREGAPSWGNKPMTSLTVQFDEGIPELYLNTSSLFDSQNNLYEVWSDKIDSHHKKYMKITQQETEQ